MDPAIAALRQKYWWINDGIKYLLNIFAIMWRRRWGFLFQSPFKKGANLQNFPIIANIGNLRRRLWCPEVTTLRQKYWWINDGIKIFIKYFAIMWRRRGEFLFYDNSQSLPIMANRLLTILISYYWILFYKY